MNLFGTVLEIVAPVFLLAMVGFTWVKLGFEYPVAFVTRLAMTLAVPCLIFTALMKTQIDPSALATLLFASIAAHVLVAAIGAGGFWLLGLSQRTFLAPFTFGNTGNLGLPLALFAFGVEGLGYAMVVFAVTATGVEICRINTAKAVPLSAKKSPTPRATDAQTTYLMTDRTIA